ncbi:MAG TPA: tetratricopeptide repeat protein [Myxococcota bacterium]|nr:tetratricopeptide repeat protein [Myxococcota bacterium]
MTPSRRRLGLFALTVATMLVYGQVLDHTWLSYDDPLYVTENPVVREGLTWHAVRWSLTTFHAANWHPLTWLSHLVDASVLGDAAGPRIAENAAIHLASALLLYRALRRMSGADGPSLFVAGVFALHPLHVESVAWLSARKDVLSGLLFALALNAYAAYAERGGGARYAAVVLLHGLGLLAKPTTVTLPCVLLLLDVWPLRRLATPRGVDGRRASALRLVGEKLPLLALSAASAAVTLAAQSAGGALASIAALPLDARAENAVLSILRYVALAVWPSGLAPLQPYPRDLASPARVAEAIAGAFALGLATLLCWRARGTRPHLLVGWLWFLGMLVPVLGIVQVGAQASADRYTYLPLVGLASAVAWQVADASQRRGAHGARRAVPLAAVGVLLAFALVSSRQVGFWKDGTTLFARSVAVTKDNAEAHLHLGLAFEERGEAARAEAEYRHALEIDPRSAEAHTNLGAVLAERGRAEEAVAHFEAALSSRPDSAPAHTDLGNALLAEGRDDDAREHFRRALESDPDLEEARLGLAAAETNLGVELLARGQLEDAIARFREALRIAPERAEAQLDLAVALLRAGREEEAATLLAELLRRRPEWTQVREELARLEARHGSLAEPGADAVR